MEQNADVMLRKKGVAALLGVSRFTLNRIIAKEPTFPKFLELAPGIHMVRASQVREWISRKELEARK